MSQQQLPADHNQAIERVLAFIPGFAIWFLLLSPIWAGKAFPFVMADFLIILSIYWTYSAFVTTLGSTIGMWRVWKDEQKDWLQLCQELNRYDLPDPDNLPVQQELPKHLLVYPQLFPDAEILKRTLEGIQQQNYPKELIYIAISFEERAIKKDPHGDKKLTEVKETLRQEFPELSPRMYFYVHPADIEGEAIGAAANRTWGAKSAVAELEKQGEVISDFLVTAPDEDLVFHHEYLGACSYQYLITEKRQRRFYQTALYTFNNNYWEVPILIRVLVAALTIPVLGSSITARRKRETFSCYTVNLSVLQAVGYWDTRYGIDDTPFYWRPFFYFNGDWECEVFFVRLSADAIASDDYVKNHRLQYKQYLRWGWGVIAFPIGFKGLLSNPGIPLYKRITKLLDLFEFFVFWKVLAFLITLAAPIVFLLNPELRESVAWYSVPNTVSFALTLAAIFLIPTTIYKAIIAPPKPKKWSWPWYIFILIIEAPLNIITVFLYSSLPFIEASTRFMLGEKEAKAVKNTWSISRQGGG